MAAERFFNTEGPIVPERHYHVPPLSRLNVGAIQTLIDQARYFVLHAPRQTGKTSALEALKSLLNASGNYRCVYVNVEVAQSAREDIGAAMQAILSELAFEAGNQWQDDVLDDIWPETLAMAGPHAALRACLSRWAAASPRPLVLLIDEIDALIGDTLLAVLRQLRAGYRRRPAQFPQSVVLCGVRDVRDYRIRSTAEGTLIDGGSAFNVSAGSLRLGDFRREEVEELVAQHTTATGQAWSEDALQEVWDSTQGQPWLVNALAAACTSAAESRQASASIARSTVQQAREQLIESRATHLDQLAHKLAEDRVHGVIEPLLSGASHHPAPSDDLQYVRDLGLIAGDDPIRIANPIYREVIPRDLTYTTQAGLPLNTADYIGDDGDLDVAWLLTSFQTFFREHSEHWIERFQYREAGPQLLLQAFLQRIVNGGGRVEREYGRGRMRTDLLVLWPRDDRSDMRFVIECKLLHRSLARTIRDGLAQTRAYMDRADATEGHLVIFDRTDDKDWDARTFHRTEQHDGTSIDVWGM